MRSLRDTLSGSEASCRDFGAKATSSVITVATNLLDTGKEVPVAAAKAGELETLQVIHEPVAGVLACAAEQKLEEQGVSKNILVDDLGGTRCDAAVVTSMGGMWTILVKAQDYGLGGLELDEVLVDDLLKGLIEKHNAHLGNERSIAKLRLEAEGRKRTLSLGTSATISIESLTDRYDLHSTVNRVLVLFTSRQETRVFWWTPVRAAKSPVAKRLEPARLVAPPGSKGSSPLGSCTTL